MTNPPLSTMAPSVAITPSRANQTVCTAPTDTTTRLVTKSLITRDFDLMIHAFFRYLRHLWSSINQHNAPSQTTTEVIGIKGALKDAKLLGEFFMRMASKSNNDPCDGVFLPKGVVHLLGMTTYEQVLKENIFFLNNVATIPVNMKYAAWFAIVDPAHQSKNEPVSLHEHLTCQW